MTNPFQLRWLNGWIFQVVLMGGKIHVEAYGFGICLKTSLQAGETPSNAADRLVLAEDKRRKYLYNNWLYKKNIKPTNDSLSLESTKANLERRQSLVVVNC